VAFYNRIAQIFLAFEIIVEAAFLDSACLENSIYAGIIETTKVDQTRGDLYDVVFGVGHHYPIEN
jgi:hypothetical protein